MKTDTSKKGLYIGAMAGLMLFIFIGLLPSCFVGGVLGLKIASYLLSTSAETALLCRAVVGLSMVTGILAAGCVFVIGMAFIGWSIAHLTLISRIGRVLRSV
ncbi:MAG: hypothetical protein ACLPN1_09475 [Dissulfurispiraceae bacterium]|jgi:hypothetical protein